MELLNKPGIIISDKIIKTTKVKKYIDKNKISYSDIIYLEDVPSDFRELDRALVNLENKYLGKKEVAKVEKDPPVTTRGCSSNDAVEIADIIHRVLSGKINVLEADMLVKKITLRWKSVEQI